MTQYLNLKKVVGGGERGHKKGKGSPYTLPLITVDL